LREALAAGLAAVARADGEGPQSHARPGDGALPAGVSVALLVPGMSGARLDAALAAFRGASTAAGARVVIADHLPPSLDPRAAARPGGGPDAPGFEHLMPLADLLEAADPAAAVAHLARRVEIILDRRAATWCLWAGSEAEVIVQAIAARIASRLQGVPPLSGPLAANGGHAAPVAQRIFRPLAFRD
jgi:hypothetical protein